MLKSKLLLLLLLVAPLLQGGDLEYGLQSDRRVVISGGELDFAVYFRNAQHRPMILLRGTVFSVGLRYRYRDALGAVQDHYRSVVRELDRDYQMAPFAEQRFDIDLAPQLPAAAAGGALSVELGGRARYRSAAAQHPSSRSLKASTLLYISAPLDDEAVTIASFAALGIDQAELIIPMALQLYPQDSQRVLTLLVNRLSIPTMRPAALFALQILAGAEYREVDQWRAYLVREARRAKVDAALRAASRVELRTRLATLDLSQPWIVLEELRLLSGWEGIAELLEEDLDLTPQRSSLRDYIKLCAGDERPLPRLFKDPALAAQAWNWQRVVMLNLIEPLQIVSLLPLAREAFVADDLVLSQEAVGALTHLDPRWLYRTALERVAGLNLQIQLVLLQKMRNFKLREARALLGYLSRSSDAQVAGLAYKILHRKGLANKATSVLSTSSPGAGQTPPSRPRRRY